MSAAALVSLLAVVSPVHAITIASGNPATTGVVTYGETVDGVNLSGVVEITIAGIGGCSGSLLSDGISILTAGHCVMTSSFTAAASAVTVYFPGSNGMIAESVSGVQVDPGYNGSNSTSGADLAVLTLSQPAPASATEYSLDTSSAIPSSPVLIAGYGIGGTGATGYDATDYPFGTLRAGENVYEGEGGVLGYSNSLLIGQFYEAGDRSTNALKVRFPYSSSDEVDISPGDSGGPSFFDGEIIGVHDLGICYLSTTDSSDCAEPPSVTSGNDSSFGEIFADTSVDANLTFIEDAVADTAVPEPGTAALFFCSLIAVTWRRIRLRKIRAYVSAPRV